MHLCIAGSVRAMPEKEKPPAMPVDIYCPGKYPMGVWEKDSDKQWPDSHRLL